MEGLGTGICPLGILSHLLCTCTGNHRTVGAGKDLKPPPVPPWDSSQDARAGWGSLSHFLPGINPTGLGSRVKIPLAFPWMLWQRFVHLCPSLGTGGVSRPFSPAQALPWDGKKEQRPKPTEQNHPSPKVPWRRKSSRGWKFLESHPVPLGFIPRDSWIQAGTSQRLFRRSQEPQRAALGIPAGESQGMGVELP